MFPNFALLLLINAQQEVLLLRRINTPFCNNCFSLPGGQIELHESATQTIFREAKNSLGIDLTENLELVHTMSRKCNDPEFIACFFKFTGTLQTIENKTPERYDMMQWFPISHLPENIVPAHKQALLLIAQNINYSEHGWDK
jgi:ADP-ribose pyrophosphatase YjhB (NUDIX family)